MCCVYTACLQVQEVHCPPTKQLISLLSTATGITDGEKILDMDWPWNVRQRAQEECTEKPVFTPARLFKEFVLNTKTM
jgi:hypothetical protein